jgi:hypothetical protein
LKRKCVCLIKSINRKRAIYIDLDNQKEILDYINKDPRHIKKFRFITEIILEGHKIPSLYDKEEINKKIKGVTAMKFFKGQENDRIYCKEINTSSGIHIVVASILYERKKSNKLNNIQKAIINKVNEFDYEIE